MMNRERINQIVTDTVEGLTATGDFADEPAMLAEETFQVVLATYMKENPAEYAIFSQKPDVANYLREVIKDTVHEIV